ncbi:hypothetical protein M5K25_001767 [Dendrobium thyrsiflorum]|uniref:RNase H type-1 domain-containing protein n=1 Tax=Dendrobium thyrsiflorum TaxID=117978 RepID=A0ABD0W3Z1_DENTH
MKKLTSENHNGAFSKPYRAGLGIVVRNAEGKLIVAAGKQLLHWDVAFIELQSITILKEVLNEDILGSLGIIIEGDNQAVLNWLHKNVKLGRWRFNSLDFDLSFIRDFHHVEGPSLNATGSPVLSQTHQETHLVPGSWLRLTETLEERVRVRERLRFGEKERSCEGLSEEITEVSQGESLILLISLFARRLVKSCVKTPVSAWVLCLHQGVVKKEEAVLCRHQGVVRKESGSLPSPRSAEGEDLEGEREAPLEPAPAPNQNAYQDMIQRFDTMEANFGQRFDQIELHMKVHEDQHNLDMVWIRGQTDYINQNVAMINSYFTVFNPQPPPDQDPGS